MMSFVRPLARAGMFGLAGLALSKKKDKPEPSLANSGRNIDPSLVNSPTTY